MGRMISRGLIVAALVLTGVALRVAPATAADTSAAPPGKYMLSLGDSLGYGYQGFKAAAEVKAGNVDPTTFNTGYSDDLYRMLHALNSRLQLVNYSCPGETSSQFVSSPGCPFPLHDSYATSQLQAALTFLQAHPGQVNPIVVDMGANDIEAQISACGGLATGVSCVAAALPALLQKLGTNLGQILGTLRQGAPGAQILFVGLYNPYSAGDTSTNALAVGVNKVLTSVTAATGVTFVDTFTAFNLATPQPQTICALTLFCANQDIHPTDAGYLTIAKLLWNASAFPAQAHGFMVTFTSTTPGYGQVYFGSGPACAGLVEVATNDLQPVGTTHIVYVAGNDLPGTVGDNGIQPGVKYSYETVSWGKSGPTTVDNNGGNCYVGSQPTS